MSSNQAVRDFIAGIEIVRNLLREEEIYLAKRGRLKNIEVSISPIKQGISFFLDADFAAQVISEGRAIGLTITISYSNSGWVLEDYIHYPEGEIDWYEYQDDVQQFRGIEDLLQSLSKFVQKAVGKYRRIIETAQGRTSYPSA